MAAPTKTSLWRPGNALMAFGILFLRACARLPMGWLQGMGKALGSCAAILFPFRKQVGTVNLSLCFPELSERERWRLLRRHYQSIGMGVFELASAWYKPGAEILAHTDTEGLEHLDKAKASGRGVLLLGAHWTTLEIAGRCLIEQAPFGCLYRHPNQPYLNKVMTERRHRFMTHVVHFSDVRRMVRLLRQGEVIWYAPDQGRRLKDSTLIPFFGVPAVTNTATSRIARMGKAAIIPFFGHRDASGRYQVRILPELEGVPSDDPEADALAINRLYEAWIREAPEQYFWLHKRFKRRGPDLPDVYAPSTGQ